VCGEDEAMLAFAGWRAEGEEQVAGWVGGEAEVVFLRERGHEGDDGMLDEWRGGE